jgi:hypothetical protein
MDGDATDNGETSRSSRRAFARVRARGASESRKRTVHADRLAPNARRFLDARERPAQSPERADLLLCGVVQDVAHPGEGLHVHRLRQRLGRRQLIAGFEVSINCRFWVSAEAAFVRVVLHRNRQPPRAPRWMYGASRLRVVTQQARQVAWTLADRAEPIRFLIRDNDRKFTS